MLTRDASGCLVVLAALSGLAVAAPRSDAKPPVARQGEPTEMLPRNRMLTVDFPSQRAKFVRLVPKRTDGGAPCIDEIEIYGAEGRENLAAASGGAVATASSCMKGYAAHRIEHLNDGKYGNAYSWIPDSGPSWAQIELAREASVRRVVFSRDRLGGYVDRQIAEFDVQVSGDGRSWTTVKRVIVPTRYPLDRQHPSETLQDWADRMARRLRGPLGQAACKIAGTVRTKDDFRPLTALLELDAQRSNAKAALALQFNPAAIRRAVADLGDCYPGRYRLPAGFQEKLAAGERRLPRIAQALDAGDEVRVRQALAECDELFALQRTALLANPLLSFGEILVLKRRTSDPSTASQGVYWDWGQKYGMPVNWSCDFRPKNPPIAPWWEDEIVAVSLAGQGPRRTIFKAPKTHMLQHPDLHFDADRLLFAMPGPNGAFQVFEVRVDGTLLRQVTRDTGPDIDNGDACYLPDGRILFNSTRMFTGVPCEDGESYVSNLCLTDAEGRHTRMLTFDQESNWYPSLLNDGRVLYTRYEYANVSHQFGRLLFHMNPDGTSQMEYYGSNSYWPNSIFYARAIPNHPTMVAGVVCGHHGPNRTGRLVLFDPARGRDETRGAVQTIPGYGKPVKRIVEDTLYAGDWPKFAHPWPLSDKYYLVAARLGPDQEEYGIYLADVFDNMTEICRLPGHSLFEPIPLAKRKTPPQIPDRVRPESKEATVYLANIYEGPGLRGIPPGSVKRLRLFTYDYFYRHTSHRGFGHLATPGIDGPWEPRCILGTVPVSESGTARFTVPANTPISVQPLDGQGRALQQMRSWFTAMPGETISCVGCHERQNTSPTPMAAVGYAGRPDRIAPWRGPARGFDYQREVQPVLDRYCVGCHDGSKSGRPDLSRKSEQERLRINREYHRLTESSISTTLTPSFIALHPYVRRPHAESNYGPQVAAEYTADTSLLVQMLRKGHHNVAPDDEAWDRLTTWIDLGAPDHGSWQYSVWGVQSNYYQRRLEMLRQYAGRTDDVEWLPPLDDAVPKFIAPAAEKPAAAPPKCAGWPFGADEAQRRQAAVGLPKSLVLKLPGDQSLDLVLIPPGEFVMGDPQGAPDEREATAVRIDRPFYMSRCEVTNAQYAALADPAHTSGVVGWMSIDWRGEGYPLTEAAQPVVRVSWLEAKKFCQALSATTGRKIELPSEAQWEWACRAGTSTPLWYGGPNDDFSTFENLAGREQQAFAFSGKPKWFLRDDRFDDHNLVTAPVASYRPNPWGLYDMAGNASEWTRTTYHGPRAESLADVEDSPSTEKVVRGGSWSARPREAGSAYRWKYPAWRKIHNVGFRIILEVN